MASSAAAATGGRDRRPRPEAATGGGITGEQTKAPPGGGAFAKLRNEEEVLKPKEY
jgi:hypothetical protein